MMTQIPLISLTSKVDFFALEKCVFETMISVGIMRCERIDYRHF